MALFWTAVSADPLRVKVSVPMARLRSVDPVAGDPATVAWKETDWRGRRAEGVPTIRTVLFPTFDSDRPVPASAGAVIVTGFPEAATARISTGLG
jgi:hypothetical protein